jgi:hypothetical protein
MSDKRSKEREICYAHVLWPGRSMPGFVRDINDIGCKVEFLEDLPDRKGLQAKITIIPEQDTNIESFDLQVEIRWRKDEPPIYTLGCNIIEASEASMSGLHELRKLYA